MPKLNPFNRSKQPASFHLPLLIEFPQSKQVLHCQLSEGKTITDVQEKQKKKFRNPTVVFTLKARAFPVTCH